jgi:hypothetical protein
MRQIGRVVCADLICPSDSVDLRCRSGKRAVTFLDLSKERYGCVGRCGRAFERSITHCGKTGVSLGGLPRVIAQ